MRNLLLGPKVFVFFCVTFNTHDFCACVLRDSGIQNGGHSALKIDRVCLRLSRTPQELQKNFECDSLCVVSNQKQQAER